MEAALPDSKSPDSQPYVYKSAIETINTTSLTVLLAAVYVATGYLGTLLAIPPGNVSILWPPSGIAMAAMLICGPRASIGIFLGAVIVNGQAFIDSRPIADQMPAVIAALTIGLGSVLQPLAGRYLIAKFSNREDPFKDGRTILKSVGIFAVACLISSNIGSQSLVITGITDGSALNIFQTWWLGDLIGVIVFAPLFLAIFKQSRTNAATLVLATAVSFGGTFYVSEQVRSSAEDAWDTRATREAERLTTTLVSWLETAISPVNSIGALFESSDDVFEDEFLEASIRLEDFQPDFFPSVLGLVATIPGAGGEDEWEVLYSTNETGFLTPGDIIKNNGMGSKALKAALEEPGRLVIGEFAEFEDEQLAMAAIAIERSDFEQIAVGAINLGQMFDGLFAVQVPEGFHVTVDGAGSADNPEELQSVYKHGHIHETLITTKTIRGTSGSAQLTFNWDVTDKFLPGSRTELPNAVLIGGILGSAVLILFLTFVLGQNEQIRQRVRERTAELDRERAVLQATMEAMDQGLSMFNGDLVLTARNTKFMDMFELPTDTLPIGSHMGDMFRINVERGEYGDGDPVKLVEDRLELASKYEPHRFERQRPDGRYIEVRGNPLPDGAGFVTTYTDITERKLAEQEIERQRAQLDDILSNISQGIVKWDKDKKLAQWNDVWPDMLQVQEDMLKPGVHLYDFTLNLAQREFYGEGDPSKITEERVAALWEGETRADVSFGDDRKFFAQSTKTPDGGLIITFTDISERKKAEEEIAQKQAALRTTLDNMPGGICMVDADLKIQVVNQKYCELYGHEPDVYRLGRPIEEVIRMNVEAGYHAGGNHITTEVNSAVRRRIRAFRSGVAGESERELPNGNVLHIRHNPIDGGGIVLVATDVTDRKRAEQELANKEAQLRMAMENMPGAMVVVNPDLEVVLVNEAYKEFYGDPDGLVQAGANMADLLASEVSRGILAGAGSSEDILRDRVEGYRKGLPLSTIDRTLDGRDIQLVRRPIDGGYTICVAVDITELKKTERELANKEALLSAALENMTGGLFMVDAALKLRVFNDRLIELYELEPDFLEVGFPLKSILQVRAERGDYGPGESADLVKERLASYRNRDVQIIIDTVGEKTIEVYRAPVEDGGMVCVFNDITERKRAEDELTKAHSLITESLTYASRIQRSLLPPQTIMEEVFKDHCVIWEPTATVGGDMIWLRPAAGGVYLIVADCTGHGPPGAFMTMICTGALDQALAETEGADPAEILKLMNRRIKTALGQDSEHGESDDGVELGVCHINSKSQTIMFAGARFSLEIIENKEMTEIKGNKSAIGYRHVPHDAQFDNHTLSYNSDMQFYMWTDGMVDQIGGPKRRSFGKRRLRKIIMDYSQMGMAWQRSQVLREFEDYQHTEQRRDDITMVGFIPRNG